jgi:hypothetical protein
MLANQVDAARRADDQLGIGTVLPPELVPDRNHSFRQ